LRGDVGLGKSAALVALASRLLREQPTARALVVVPAAALRAHWVEMLRLAGTPTLSVDRYQFRALLDSTTGEEVWPSGVVAVINRDFARQEDIRAALANVRWDLLIVDEAHQFGENLGRELLRLVGESSERIVLATVPHLEIPDAFSETSATVVQWRRDRVVDDDGVPLDVIPRPRLHEIHFNLSPAELDLAETVRGLSRIFEVGTYPANLCRLLWRPEFSDCGEDLGQAIGKSIKAIP
jgi:hypothetical protein